MLAQKPLIVDCSRFDHRGKFFSSALSHYAQWKFVYANEGCLPGPLGRLGALGRGYGAFQACRLAIKENAKLFISHDPLVTYQCALLLSTLGYRGKHMAFAFNFSSLPKGPKNKIMRAFRSIDRFVVYSSIERELYAKVFDIPKNRIDFIHWGVNPPIVEPDHRPIVQGDYICAIGGNARDYATLMNAIKPLPEIPLVLVARPQNVVNLSLPPNVKLLTNIPFGAAMNILKFSRFMVLPLMNNEVPCGHVTLVAAMHLSKAFAITNSCGVADYVSDGNNSLVAPAGDKKELSRIIQQMWNDQNLCARLGSAGATFAANNCNEHRTLLWLKKYFQHIGIHSSLPEIAQNQ